MSEPRHPPTTAKLRRLRLQGDVPRSYLLSQVLPIVVGMAVSAILLPGLAVQLLQWSRIWWSQAACASASETWLASKGADRLASWGWLLWTLGILGAGWLGAILTGWLQNGWRLQRLRWQTAAIASGMARRAWLSPQRLATIAAQVMTLLALCGLLMFGTTSSKMWESFARIATARTPTEWVNAVLAPVSLVVVLVLACLLLSAVGDWWVQRYLWWRAQWMTDEELREEARQDQGPRKRKNLHGSGSGSVAAIDSINTN